MKYPTRMFVRRCDDKDGLRSFDISDADHKVVADVYVRDAYGPGGHRDEAEARMIAHLFAEAPHMAMLLHHVQKFCPVDTQDHIRMILRTIGWPGSQKVVAEDTARDERGYTKEGVVSLAKVAYQRGLKGHTFATADESRHPVHVAAYSLGSGYRNGRAVEPHCLVGCGCVSCRLARTVVDNSSLFSKNDLDEVKGLIHS